MSDQPQIVFPKNILSSKTFWTNLLAPVFIYLTTKYGLDLTPDQQAIIVAAVMAGVNVLLRAITNGPVGITSPMLTRQGVDPSATVLFSPHLDGPVILNPGSHEVVVPPPPVPPTPKVTIRDLTP